MGFGQLTERVAATGEPWTAHTTPGQEQPADDSRQRRQQVEKWQEFDMVYRQGRLSDRAVYSWQCRSYCEHEQKRLPPFLSPRHHRHDRGGGDGQPAKHVAINRDQRCPAG